MRNKIKQILNKEEGFTLVELLAVIVILAIIVAIAVPAIGNVIGSSQTKAVKAETELVEDAARLYFTDGKNKPENNTTVTIETLEEAGYLDLRGNESIEPTHSVSVTVVGNKVTYEFTHPGVSTP